MFARYFWRYDVLKLVVEGMVMFKLVVFVPETEKEAVKSALFDAGAGRLGAYQSCCWEVLGRGQFKPVAGAVPHTGTLDVLEVISEYRIEMLVDELIWPRVKAALHAVHPYEEPAFDLMQLLDVDSQTQAL